MLFHFVDLFTLLKYLVSKNYEQYLQSRFFKVDLIIALYVFLCIMSSLKKTASSCRRFQKEPKKSSYDSRFRISFALGPIFKLTLITIRFLTSHQHIFVCQRSRLTFFLYRRSTAVLPRWRHVCTLLLSLIEK